MAQDTDKQQEQPKPKEKHKHDKPPRARRRLLGTTLDEKDLHLLRMLMESPEMKMGQRAHAVSLGERAVAYRESREVFVQELDKRFDAALQQGAASVPKWLTQAMIHGGDTQQLAPRARCGIAMLQAYMDRRNRLDDRLEAQRERRAGLGGAQVAVFLQQIAQAPSVRQATYTTTSDADMAELVRRRAIEVQAERGDDADSTQ